MKAAAGTLRARVVAVGVGVGFLAAAAVSAASTFSNLAETRPAHWPLPAADASTFALFGFLALLGALALPAALADGSLLLLAYFVANYESESVVAPGIGVAAAALLYAYVRGGRGIRDLGIPRIVLLVLSALAGLASIIAMQAEGGVLAWERVRTPSGGTDVRVFKTSGGCRVFEDAPKDVDQIDSGCEQIIPPRRARYVIGYNTTAALLAVTAAAGAKRRPPPEESPARV